VLLQEILFLWVEGLAVVEILVCNQEWLAVLVVVEVKKIVLHQIMVLVLQVKVIMVAMVLTMVVQMVAVGVEAQGQLGLIVQQLLLVAMEERA
jgi:hypothetical protein